MRRPFFLEALNLKDLFEIFPRVRELCNECVARTHRARHSSEKPGKQLENVGSQRPRLMYMRDTSHGIRKIVSPKKETKQQQVVRVAWTELRMSIL